MKKTRISTAVLILAVAAWAGAGSSALAAPGGEDGKDKEAKKVRRIVVVDKNGEQQVIEGDGLNVRHGYFGIGMTEMTHEMRRHFGVPDEAGVIVSRVDGGSPAEKAGVKVGDILTSLDGKPVETSWDIMVRVRKLEDGQQVPLEIWRDGRMQTMTATIALRERPELDMGPLFIRSEDGNDLLLRGDFLKETPLHRIEIPGPGEGGGTRVLRMREREADLEKRLKEAEKRINELESQLKKK